MTDPDQERAEFAQLKDELRRLAEEWRETAAQRPFTVRGTYEICADELEELVDDE